jgi:hypothetical protein
VISLSAGSRFNEGRACDAVIRYLERRHNTPRLNLRFPEREHHAAPIEVALELDRQLFAMEHSTIEPFEGHTHLQATGDVAIRPVSEAVAGRLPPTEDFELHMPSGALAGLRKRRLNEVQRLLADWIIRHRLRCRWRPWGVAYPRSRRPFRGFHSRSNSIEWPGLVRPGHLQIVNVVENVEVQREARIGAMLEKKLPKLNHWKQHHAAQTLLVLEQDDLQLTNVHLVTNALLKAEAAQSNIADQVYLVSTMISPWWVHWVRIGKVTYFDLTHPDDRGWEVDPANLDPITESASRAWANTDYQIPLTGGAFNFRQPSIEGLNNELIGASAGQGILRAIANGEGFVRSNCHPGPVLVHAFHELPIPQLVEITTARTALRIPIHILSRSAHIRDLVRRNFITFQLDARGLNVDVFRIHRSP